MTLGIRLFAVAVAVAVAVGALLTFAVKATLAEIDTGTVGVVLMVIHHRPMTVR